MIETERERDREKGHGGRDGQQKRDRKSEKEKDGKLEREWIRKQLKEKDQYNLKNREIIIYKSHYLV